MYLKINKKHIELCGYKNAEEPMKYKFLKRSLRLSRVPVRATVANSTAGLEYAAVVFPDLLTRKFPILSFGNWNTTLSFASTLYDRFFTGDNQTYFLQILLAYFLSRVSR